MSGVDPKLQSNLECFWKGFENGFEIKENKISILKVVKFILESLTKLSILFEQGSIFETILEFDLNLAWDLKTTNRKGFYLKIFYSSFSAQPQEPA